MLPGFYLGIYVWGKLRRGEDRLVGSGGFPPEHFEFQMQFRACNWLLVIAIIVWFRAKKMALLERLI